MDSIEWKMEEAIRLALVLKVAGMLIIVPPKAGSGWAIGMADLAGMLSGNRRGDLEGKGESLHGAMNDLINNLKARIGEESRTHEARARELQSAIHPRD